MIIRKAKIGEIAAVKKLVDSAEELDTIPETFSEAYFQSILQKGVLFVGIDKSSVVGVCFGEYNLWEQWSEIMGVVVKENYRMKGLGKQLMNSFEEFIKGMDITTVDLYCPVSRKGFVEGLGYEAGRENISFRKKL